MDVAHRLQNQGLNAGMPDNAYMRGVRDSLCARHIAYLMIALCLGACNMVGERAKSYVPTLTFAHYKTLPLDVGKMKIHAAYDANAHENNIANLFPTTPEDALMRYWRQRYTASRDYRTKLDVIVRDAHAIREKINKKSGGMIFFGLKRRERYTVFIDLALEHRTAEGQLIRRVVLNFRKGLIMPISLSLAERETRMNAFIQRFVQDIDKAVQKAMRESLYILPETLRTVPEGHDKGLMPGMGLKPASSESPEMRTEQNQNRQ